MIANAGGHCFLGKIPMELLHLSWEKSLNLSSGQRAEMLSTVDLHSCFLKVCKHDNCWLHFVLLLLLLLHYLKKVYFMFSL